MSDERTEPGDDHERFAVDVAGYVLGGLTQTEARAFEAHLITCPACRHELEELDPIPVLLDLSITSTVGPELVASDLTAEIDAPGAPRGEPTRGEPARGRRRGRLAMGAAVAVLAVAAAFLIGVMVARPDDSGYSQAVALHPATTAQGVVAAPSATGAVSVRPADHGTEVRLDVSGLPATAGTWYECLWWSTDGVRSAGTFRVTAGGATQVELTTAAELRPGWRLAILEHPAAHATPVTVLSTST